MGKYKISFPNLMLLGQRSHMTRFARALDPDVIMNYDNVSDTLSIVHADFEIENAKNQFVQVHASHMEGYW